jgi:hypothetical protein
VIFVLGTPTFIPKIIKFSETGSIDIFSCACPVVSEMFSVTDQGVLNTKECNVECEVTVLSVCQCLPL